MALCASGRQHSFFRPVARSPPGARTLDKLQNVVCVRVCALSTCEPSSATRVIRGGHANLGMRRLSLYCCALDLPLLSLFSDCRPLNACQSPAETQWENSSRLGAGNRDEPEESNTKTTALNALNQRRRIGLLCSATKSLTANWLRRRRRQWRLTGCGRKLEREP